MITDAGDSRVPGLAPRSCKDPLSRAVEDGGAATGRDTQGTEGTDFDEFLPGRSPTLFASLRTSTEVVEGLPSGTRATDSEQVSTRACRARGSSGARDV